MSLRVKSGCKIEIAEKDIEVYKLIDSEKSTDKFWCAHFRSIIENKNILFEYNKIINTSCKHLETNSHLDGKYYEIDEGFFAFTLPIDQINKRLKYIGKYVKAIIPKGAEYCFGEYDTIVSNQIIVFNDEN